MKKSSSLTVTDQFCGAGGSSQGVRAVANRIKGVEVKLALNHWKLAIETHQTNFPNTLHDCTDISACDPRRYPTTDILITSPECTNHSLAKGQKQVKAQLDLFDKKALDPAAERSRATMWDVPRFAEYHNYSAIIVENVVDARKWVMFDAWLMAMHSLGYLHQCVYLNSVHAHPTPQSRDRMYIIFWKKGNRKPDLNIMPMAYCYICSTDVNAVQSWKNKQKQYGKYKQQYVYCCPTCTTVVEPYYYAAFNCIDWSDLGTRIGDRSKTLSANTLKRIKHGLYKYKNQQALLNPFIINDQHSTGVDCRVRSVNDKLWSIPTQHHMKLISPFIIKLEHSHSTGNVKSAIEHLQTQCTRQSFGLVTPQIVEMHRTGNTREITNPLNTVTAGGGKSGILTDESWKSFFTYYYKTMQHTTADESLRTVTTADRTTIINYQEPVIDDCYFRMLKPCEIKKAMAFENEYIILGNHRDQVKQLGNAVTPPAMEILVERIIKSLN